MFVVYACCKIEVFVVATIYHSKLTNVLSVLFAKSSANLVRKGKILGGIVKIYLRYIHFSV